MCVKMVCKRLCVKAAVCKRGCVKVFAISDGFGAAISDAVVRTSFEKRRRNVT